MLELMLLGRTRYANNELAETVEDVPTTSKKKGGGWGEKAFQLFTGNRKASQVGFAHGVEHIFL